MRNGDDVRTWLRQLACDHRGGMSALPPKADKERTCRDVRFVTKADICAMAPRSVLTAKVLGYNESAANFAFVEPEREYGPAPFGRHSACTICSTRDELEAA